MVEDFYFNTSTAQLDGVGAELGIINLPKISFLLEDDHPLTTNKKWTDSLETARRRKSREEKERMILEMRTNEGT